MTVIPTSRVAEAKLEPCMQGEYLVRELFTWLWGCLSVQIKMPYIVPATWEEFHADLIESGAKLYDPELDTDKTKKSPDPDSHIVPPDTFEEFRALAIKGMLVVIDESEDGVFEDEIVHHIDAFFDMEYEDFRQELQVACMINDRCASFALSYMSRGLTAALESLADRVEGKDKQDEDDFLW